MAFSNSNLLLIFLSLCFVLSMCGILVYYLRNLRLSDVEYGFPYYTKEMWGGVRNLHEDERRFKTPVPYVIIHHTAIPGACNTTQRCSISMQSMQAYHMSMGWDDIGYNFCVGSEGGAYEGRGWHTVGVHAGPGNSVSIGLCLIGDWRAELPPAIQLETTKQLITAGIDLGIISSEYKLIGHNQAMETECPGEALMSEISTWEHYQPGKINFRSHINNKATKL